MDCVCCFVFAKNDNFSSFLSPPGAFSKMLDSSVQLQIMGATVWWQSEVSLRQAFRILPLWKWVFIFFDDVVNWDLIWVKQFYSCFSFLLFNSTFIRIRACNNSFVLILLCLFHFLYTSTFVKLLVNKRFYCLQADAAVASFESTSRID